MADPFVAEIRLVAFTFSPRGWAFCSGQILPIAQNTALFSLLGTTYGGNGQTNFSLPDIRGRAPMGVGQGSGLSPRALGEVGGASTVTLLLNEMPNHTHTSVTATASAASTNTPTDKYYANTSSVKAYATGANTMMRAGTLTAAGSDMPHNNMQPFVTVNFCIALQGIYPPRP